MTNVIYQTQSLCPECLRIVDAEVYEEDNRVMIRKSCPEHGEVVDVYWEDAEFFKKAMRFASEGKKVDPITEYKKCPFSCGICDNHKTHPALLNIAVTNRCDFACWYCFFYAERSGFVFEPTIEQIKNMVRTAKNLKPIACNGVQLTGGEPALREDLIEVIKAVKSEGVKHVQLNTNGIRLAKDPDFALEVKKAGVDVVYLSFDGLDEKTNPKNHREIPRIFENCRKAQLDLVLVPTIIKNVNDHQLGDMIRFAAKNIDLVRSVSIQPVSFVGKMSNRDLKKYRITIPGCIKAIEEQTNGEISREDFYPMSSSLPITRFVEAFTGVPQYTFTPHFACGVVTTVFRDGEKLIPITRFVDAEGLLEYMAERAEEIKNSRFKKIKVFKSFLDLRRFFDLSKAPKSFDVSKLLFKVLVEHSYFALYEWHRKSILLAMMHFQDLYNYDLARVQKCIIHYGSPDGRIIPFCTYNVLPEIYRDRIQREFGIPLEEWKRRHGLKEEATIKVPSK
ncbi:MAG: radical SAM protein [Archaeoglobaceae archaeon]